jgi:hypothetical protein
MLAHTVTATRAEQRFYVWMAIAAALVVLGGFAPTYFLRSFTTIARYPSGAVVSRSLPLLIHAHAIVSTSWLMLLVGQTTLVATGRIDLHRRMGIAGAVIALLLVGLGVMTAIRGARDGWNPGGPFADSRAILAVTLGDILLFASFVGAGLFLRRNREAHKRLMILGTLAGLMWPAITRMPYVAPRPPRMFGLLLLLVLAMPAWDYWTNRRVHPVAIWGPLIILASFPIRQALAATAGWGHFAEWLIR